MRRIIFGLLAIMSVMILHSCGGGGSKDGGGASPKADKNGQTLNISIYLDLSDRLVRGNLQPNQVYRDTAIINYLVDYFKAKTLGPQILKSENKMKVFFYPTPNDPQITTLAKGLSVDIGEKVGVEKTKSLYAMKDVFQTNVSQIYQSTLKAQKWVGCDIWDFFSNKKVDNLCVKDGARNIVVILTDGYLYAANNKINEGTAYSYILPQTLAVNGATLIDKRNGELKGKGLEVLLLEVNPYAPQQRDKMVKTLEDWFASMGIEKYVVAETDANMTNTETIIKNFLDN